MGETPLSNAYLRRKSPDPICPSRFFMKSAGCAPPAAASTISGEDTPASPPPACWGGCWGGCWDGCWDGCWGGCWGGCWDGCWDGCWGEVPPRPPTSLFWSRAILGLAAGQLPG